MRALTFVLALASFASAYRVLIPNPSQGWTDQGAQPYVVTSCTLPFIDFPTQSNLGACQHRQGKLHCSPGQSGV